jgi:hypothetical protein
MWKSIFTALIAGLVVQESALGQPVSSADVNIVSVTGAVSAKDFTCTVVINNQNDDDAQDAKVIVLMPLQVKGVHGHVSGGPGHCWVPPPKAPPSTKSMRFANSVRSHKEPLGLLTRCFERSQ